MSMPFVIFNCTHKQIWQIHALPLGCCPKHLIDVATRFVDKVRNDDTEVPGQRLVDDMFVIWISQYDRLDKRVFAMY